MWRLFLTVIVVAILGAVGSVGYWVYKQVDEKQQVTVERFEKFKNRKPRNDLPHIGYLAPKIELPNAKNEMITLGQEKPTLVVFWTAWSSHCQKELLKIEEIYPKYEKNLKLFFINDSANDHEEEAHQLLANKSIEHAALFDRDGKVVENYGIKVYPTCFIVGTDGKILDRWVGGLSKDEWIKKLQAYEKTQK